MKMLCKLLPLVLVMGLLAACQAAPPEKTEQGSTAAATDAVYRALSQPDAKARLDSGETITVVDVRRSDEYAAAHLPGAILVTNETILPPQQPAALPDKTAVIFVYCRTGVRSKQAAEKLLSMGYTQVYDIGGITTWPYETVSE